jgi:uridine phosphorylase
MDRAAWLTLLGLADDEVPQLLVLEGTWWRQKALDARLPHLDDVRETGMPDLWWGRRGGVPIAYCTAYGAPRAVEPVHALGTCGTPVVVQVGSCGGLQPEVRTGDVVLPTAATIAEGTSRYYGGSGLSYADPSLVRRLADALSPGQRHHAGATVTTDALLVQPPELVQAWAAGGHLGVDMETSAVLSAAAVFGMRAAAALFVWDELPGRSWTDAFSAEEQAAQAAAGEAVFAAALSLAEG